MLAAPVQVEEQVAVEPTGTVLEVLKGMFDVVVVDTSGAFDEYALEALDHTDLLVLVGTLDIPALKSLKLATGTLDLLNFPRDRWRLLLNRADSKVGLSARSSRRHWGSASPSASRPLATCSRRSTAARRSCGPTGGTR